MSRENRAVGGEEERERRMKIGLIGSGGGERKNKPTAGKEIRRPEKSTFNYRFDRRLKLTPLSLPFHSLPSQYRVGLNLKKFEIQTHASELGRINHASFAKENLRNNNELGRLSFYWTPLLPPLEIANRRYNRFTISLTLWD